jgi:methylmalonyl-CoA mutase cobalamin-binding subunit
VKKMRTDKQVLGDIGEAFVADRLREAGFSVELIGGSFPGYDILASAPNGDADVRL